KIYLLLFTILITSASFGQIVINESDADTAGTDVAEFIELFWTANTALDGYSVVLFNGSDDMSYQAFDLDGYSTDANGFFILANTPLVVAGDYDMGASNVLQNGADAIAIYQDDATNFPNDTPMTMTNLIDALVYDTADADDAALLAGLGETIQYDEAENGLRDTESIQRKADGTYETKAPTFRQANDAATCDLSLTGNSVLCDAFTAGVDTYTASVTFVGGGTSTYNVTSTSGVVGGDDPTSMAAGTITVTGIAEGTDITVNVENGGLCNLDSNVTSPTCIPGLTLPHSDDFSYADGSLIGNGSWANFSGTSGDLLIVSGQAIVQHGVPSEDALLPFTPVAGNIYYGIDFSVTSGGVITGGDYEYFALFKDSSFGFGGRLDVVEGLSGGDYTVGISSTTSTAQATWGTDLTFGVTYRAVVRFDQDAGVAQLWIDASAEGDTSISGTADGAMAIESFALRQSDSSNNETVTVDNLTIAQTFNGTLSVARNDIEGFGVYPNPVNAGEFTIRSMSNLERNVQIYDMLGKQVYNRQVQANERVQVSNLNSGIYILKVEEDGNTATRKLIIE
ncbi:MAG: T9SS type A sorting domain-containing protein, partial [Urechidicola sp.]|nr:T9SS type A sorting domain-containing protein [Urechidicola sp.]